MSNKRKCFLIGWVLIVFCVGGCASMTSVRPVSQASSAEAFSGTAAYHYALSVLLKQDGDTAGAVSEMQKALVAHPESAYLTAEMVSLYIANNEVDRALALGEEAMVSHPDDTQLRSMMGGLYFHLREYDRAIDEYRTVVKQDPQNLVAYLYLGTVYALQKKYGESEAAFRQLLAEDPDNLMGNYYFAKVLADMDRAEESEALFKKVLVDRPDFEVARIDLAQLYERTGEFEQAIGIFRDLLALNPARSNLRLKIADLLIKMKDYPAAENEFLDVLQYEPDHREARTALGLMYYDMKKFDLAAAEFTTLLSRDVTDDRIRYLLASTLEKSGDGTRAVSLFLKVSPSFELYANAQIQAAMILKDQKNLASAIDVLYEAIRQKSDQVILYLYLSSLQEDHKDLAGAEKTLLGAVQLFPRDVDVHYALGMIYEKTDRFDESIAAMETVLSIDAEHADALNFIGYSWADRGIRLDEAEDMIIRALSFKPDSGYIIDSLGWVRFKKNQYESALEHLKRANELLPDDPTILEHLGDVHLKIDKRERAKDFYRRAVERDPENRILKQKLDDLIRQP
jgi:tetratricopeptide (TPR) repeat protein